MMSPVFSNVFKRIVRDCSCDIKAKCLHEKEKNMPEKYLQFPVVRLLCTHTGFHTQWIHGCWGAAPTLPYTSLSLPLTAAQQTANESGMTFVRKVCDKRLRGKSWRRFKLNNHPQSGYVAMTDRSQHVPGFRLSAVCPQLLFKVEKWTRDKGSTVSALRVMWFTQLLCSRDSIWTPMIVPTCWKYSTFSGVLNDV